MIDTSEINKIRIKGDAIGGCVIIGGIDLSAKVHELKYTHGAGSIPILTISIYADDIAIEAENVEVKIEEIEKLSYHKEEIINGNSTN